MATASNPGSRAAGADARHLHVGWAAYYRLIERLALAVHESGYAFDSLVCLARGGMRAGDVLSRVFRVPLAILSTSSYREAGGTVAGQLDIADSITSTGGDPWGRVLLVDDLVDSGNTLERVAIHLRQAFPRVQEVRSAVIWCKASSTVVPDYYVEYLEDNPWIHQPFERYDKLRPADLALPGTADPPAADGAAAD
jgi:hypoxanthine phosphoribosyltransferase